MENDADFRVQVLLLLVSPRGCESDIRLDAGAGRRWRPTRARGQPPPGLRRAALRGHGPSGAPFRRRRPQLGGIARSGCYLF